MCSCSGCQVLIDVLRRSTGGIARERGVRALEERLGAKRGGAVPSADVEAPAAASGSTESEALPVTA